jgi:hypothetical protein
VIGRTVIKACAQDVGGDSGFRWANEPLQRCAVKGDAKACNTNQPNTLNSWVINCNDHRV